jgi:hypothetical protein
MKHSIRILLALVITALLISACGVASRNALIGKWENTTQGLALEFTMDGRMRQTSQGVTQELGFQFKDDHTIALDATATGAANTIPFTISGDKLTLNIGADQSGKAQALDFQRVK